MGRIIGPASDFYRLRIARLDESGEPDLEWRDDVLYRTLPAERVEEHESWVVESVTLDDQEAVTSIVRFDSPDEARAYLDSAQQDLEEMTKSQFEERHLSGKPGS